MCTNIMQSLTCITFMVSEKIPMLKFLTTQTLDQPKTCKLSLLNTHKSLETKAKNKTKKKVIKPTMKTEILRKVIIMQSLKDLAFTMSQKKATFFFQTRKYVNYLPCPCAKTKNSDTFITYLM